MVDENSWNETLGIRGSFLWRHSYWLFEGSSSTRWKQYHQYLVQIPLGLITFELVSEAQSE